MEYSILDFRKLAFHLPTIFRCSHGFSYLQQDISCTVSYRKRG